MNGLSKDDAIVVTGASQGIGRAIALDLARRKLRLALWDIDAEKCAATAQECRKCDAEVASFEVDVGSPDAIAKAAAQVSSRFGVVFGIINNAGIFPRASILDSTPELWRRVIDVNLMGCVNVTKAFLQEMMTARRGAVINIASGRAVQGAANGAHYAASKAAIVSFTKSLALEAAPFDIRANCIIPGLTETAQPLQELSLEQLHALGKSKIPLGRAGQPEDLTGTVHFLLSNASAFITGQSIAVNGGALMLP